MTPAYSSANRQPLAERLRLAQDPATSPADLHALAREPNSKAVKEAVASNPNTPPADLLHLAGRYWACFLENPVLPLLLLEDPGLPHRLPLRVLRALVRRENVPPYLLQTLSRHPDREVREGARYHVAAEGPTDSTGSNDLAEASWLAELRTALGQLTAQPGMLAELLSTGSIPDWLVDTVAGTGSPAVRAALFAASHQPEASAALREAASLLRRATGETKTHQYHHEYGYGASVARWREGQGFVNPAEVARLVAGNAVWQLLAARGAALAPAQQERLARSPHPRIAAAIARRADLAPSAALLLATRGLAAVAAGLAQNRRTPEPILATLARATNESVRQQVARNPSTAPATLATLATDASAAVRRRAAANRWLPTPALARLATDASAEVRERVAGNPACPMDLLEHLQHDPESAVRERLAQRAHLPQSILQALMDDESGEVQHAAIYNADTPRHILDFMNLHHHDTPAERPPMPAWGNAKGWGRGRTGPRRARLSASDEQRCDRMYGHKKPAPTEDEVVEWASSPAPELRRTVAFMTKSSRVLACLLADEDAQVRRYVAANQASPAHLLAQLADDPDEAVRAAVAGHVHTAEHLPQLVARLVAEDNLVISRSAATNAQADAALLDQLARHLDEKVRRGVAKNNNAWPITLTHLSQDESEAVRQRVLANPATPAEVLVAQLAGSSTQMRHQLASNPAAPPEVLWQLAQEPNSDIHPALAYNDGTPLPVLEYLWENQGPERKLNSALAKHPHASPDLLRRIAADAEPHAISYLPEHPAMTRELFRELLGLVRVAKGKSYVGIHIYHKGVPPWLYEVLLEDGDPDMLSSLAHQRQTPDAVLLELASRAPLVKEGFDSLTHQLVSNNTVPAAVLELLVANRAELDAQEGDPWWYEQVAAHPNASAELLRTVLAATQVHRRRRPSRWLQRRHFATWLALVQNPRLPTELLPQFADHPARQVRYALLQRPDCPADLRQQMRHAALRHNLEHGRSLLGRASALAAPDTSAEWLQSLYPKAGWVERLAMLHHPNLPADLLTALTQDAHRLVRAAALARATTGQVPSLTPVPGA